MDVLLDDSIKILKDMGIDVPSNMSKSEMNQYFSTEAANLSPEEIKKYVEEAGKICK